MSGSPNYTGLLCLAAPAILYCTALTLAGVGLLNYKPWSRNAGIVASVLLLINPVLIPINQAVGVYGLIVMLNSDTAEALKSNRDENAEYRNTT